MLSWSLKLFRVRGIQLAVHSSFFLLLAFVAWQAWQPDPAAGYAGGWSGVIQNVAILLVFFTCVVLHELGHSFTAMHFGVGVRRILLMPIGGMAEFDSIPRRPSREFLITLAGPSVNFAIAGLLWAGIAATSRLDPANQFVAEARGLAEILMEWNLVMGCFNLVPVFPMDGGRIFRAMLASRLPYLRATRIAATVGKVLAILAIAAALVAPGLHLLPRSSGYLIAALFAFIYFAGDMEYRAVRRREFEDAHWREVLAQFNASRRGAGEPPILLP